MDSARKLLIRDLLIGGSGMWVFTLPGPVPVERSIRGVVIGVAVAAVFAGGQYLSERKAFPAWLYGFRDYLRAHPLQFVVFTVAAVVVVLGTMMETSSYYRLYYAGIIGMYAGFLGYRLLYGVIRPIPETALDRV